jgi:hypothetical protein
MTTDRIAALEKEVAKLRAEVADVRDALKFECDSNTTSITKICRMITANTRDLNALMYKVLPEHAATREQIDNILRIDGLPNSEIKKT